MSANSTEEELWVQAQRYLASLKPGSGYDPSDGHGCNFDDLPFGILAMPGYEGVEPWLEAVLPDLLYSDPTWRAVEPRMFLVEISGSDFVKQAIARLLILVDHRSNDPTERRLFQRIYDRVLLVEPWLYFVRVASFDVEPDRWLLLELDENEQPDSVADKRFSRDLSGALKFASAWWGEGASFEPLGWAHCLEMHAE